MDRRSSNNSPWRDLNCNILFAAFTSSFGSAFIHGYNMGITNIPNEDFTKWIEYIILRRTKKVAPTSQVNLLWTTLVAMYSVGGLIGSIFSVCLGEALRLGRKRSLLISAVLSIVAHGLMVGSYYADSYEIFITGRLLVGFTSGINSCLSPIYLIEIAPTSLRGFIGCTYQILTALAIFISQIVGTLHNQYRTSASWDYLFSFSTIPAILQIIALPFCPPSPRFIYNAHNDMELCKKSLRFLRKREDVDYIIDEYDEVEVMLARNPNLRWLFKDKRSRTLLVVSIVMAMGQQLCGVNALIYFSNELFTGVNFSEEFAAYSVIALGGLISLATLVTMLCIDFVGRRLLLCISFCGLAMDTTVLPICLYNAINHELMRSLTVVVVLIFAVCFAIGAGTVPFVFIPEVFNYSVRARAMAIASASAWLADYLITQSFNYLIHQTGVVILLVFAIFDLFLLWFLFVYMPETAKKSHSEILDIYKDDY